MACRKYTVKTPKMDFIMDTKMFHSSLQMPYDGRKLIVVAYASYSNNKMGVKYNSYEGECLVIVWVVSSFQFVNFMVVHFSYKLLPPSRF